VNLLPTSLAAYCSVTFLLAVTPGATTAIVVRNALAGGRRTGLVAALGAACGNLTQAVLAGAGVALLLRHAPAAMLTVRLIGAAYIAWLGVRSLVKFVRGTSLLPDVDPPRPDHRSAFREALTGNLLNASVTTFYATIVPTFIPPGGGTASFAVLASIHITFALLCHVSWAMALHSLSRVFARGSFSRALEALTGVALILLALEVAFR
jgi:threonine/homoserine/homoserine lactone efflux protein